jgi:hypothetical protein
MIPSLITSRLAGPIASGVAVLFMALAMGQCTRAIRAEGKVTKAEAVAARAMADFTTCKANADGFLAAIERQNASAEAVKRETDAKLAASRKAASEARAAAESHRRSAARILAERVGPDVCADADRIALEFGG